MMNSVSLSPSRTIDGLAAALTSGGTTSIGMMICGRGLADPDPAPDPVADPALPADPIALPLPADPIALPLPVALPLPADPIALPLPAAPLPGSAPCAHALAAATATTRPIASRRFIR